MMHKSHNPSESSTTTATVYMEINGHPYYMKSKENVPYLYDIDTHDEVGYWSSKKGQYVMFSLFNKLMNSLKEKQHNEGNECHDDDDGEGTSQTTETDSSSKSQDDADDDSSSKSQDDDDELDSDSDSDVIVTRETQKKQINTYSLIFVFLMLFVYLTLQKEFQSIYFDFVFLVLINLLNTLKVFEFMNDE